MHRHLSAYLRRHHLALIALFVALGGTSYAATRLPTHSVGYSQLQVGSVTSSRVRDHSLLARDFKKGQLPKGERGPRGLTGLAGKNGADGRSAPAPEATRVLGAVGQPALIPPWVAEGAPYAAPGFFKDGQGVVHLQGAIHGDMGAPSAAFVLPPGYRPAGEQDIQAVGLSVGVPNPVAVEADGSVVPLASRQYVDLSGITFRAEG